MSSRATKETVVSLEKAQYLITSTVTQKPAIAPKLNEVFSVLPPQGEGQGPPTFDWDQAQDANVGLLEFATSDLRTKAQTYKALKAKALKIRAERRGIATDGRDVFRGARRLIDGAYEASAAVVLGLNVPPVYPFQAFEEQCLDVTGRINDPQGLERIGPPKPGRPPLDFQGIATGLLAVVEALQEVTRALRETEKLRDEALVAREKAQAFHNRVYANVARIQEAYCRLAGFDELADRIRLTIPRRSPSPAPDGDPAPDADTPAPESTDPASHPDVPTADDPTP